MKSTERWALVFLRLGLAQIFVYKGVESLVGLAAHGKSELHVVGLLGYAVVQVVVGGALALGIRLQQTVLVAGACLWLFHAAHLWEEVTKQTMWSLLGHLATVCVIIALAPPKPLLPKSRPVTGDPGEPIPLIVLIVRLGLGLDILAAGASKLTGMGQFVEHTAAEFAGSWLPGVVVVAFLYILGPLQTALGVCLVLGAGTVFALAAVAGLLLVLQFGNLTCGAGVLELWTIFLYLLFAGVGLCFASHDRYSVAALIHRAASPTHGFAGADHSSEGGGRS